MDVLMSSQNDEGGLLNTQFSVEDPPPPPLSEDSVIVNLEDDVTNESATMPNTQEVSSKSNSKSKFGLLLLGLGIFVLVLVRNGKWHAGFSGNASTVSVSGEHGQQQQRQRSLHLFNPDESGQGRRRRRRRRRGRGRGRGRGEGEGKKEKEKVPSPLCDSKIKCNNIVTAGEKVSLFEDLICADTEIPVPTNEEKCAIIVDGKDSELDCNNFMVHPATQAIWRNGICVKNGGRVSNCHVQKFGTSDNLGSGAGILIENDGEVMDCEVMFNNGHGIKAVNSIHTNIRTKISNTYVHDNDRNGIQISADARQPDSPIHVQVEGVRSNNNGASASGIQMFLLFVEDVSVEVKVKDTETSYNQETGIEIVLGYPFGYQRSKPFTLELEGSVNSRYNRFHGISIVNTKLLPPMSDETGIDVNVNGVVNIYKNGANGFIVLQDNTDVFVEKGGFLNSCKNNQTQWDDVTVTDIRNGGFGTFSGDGYVCGTTSSVGLGNEPVCKPCPQCSDE